MLKVNVTGIYAQEVRNSSGMNFPKQTRGCLLPLNSRKGRFCFSEKGLGTKNENERGNVEKKDEMMREVMKLK